MIRKLYLFNDDIYAPKLRFTDMGTYTQIDTGDLYFKLFDWGAGINVPSIRLPNVNVKLITDLYNYPFIIDKNAKLFKKYDIVMYRYYPYTVEIVDGFYVSPNKQIVKYKLRSTSGQIVWILHNELKSHNTENLYFR